MVSVELEYDVTREDTAMKRLFFYYQYAPDDAVTRRTRRAKLDDALHMIRDREIFSYMILQNTYTYAGCILNPPPKPFGRQVADIPLDSFDSSDLIVLNTRPPLPRADGTQGGASAAIQQEAGQRRVTITGQNLEQIILDNIRRHVFEECTRKKVRVKRSIFENNQHARHYAPESRCALFRISPRQCCVEKMGCGEKKDELIDVWDDQFTLGYVIYLSQLHDAQRHSLPGLLCIFSIGGTASLLFAHIVYHNYAKTIRKMLSTRQSRLIIARFSFHFRDYRRTLPPLLESVPTKHRILNDLKLDVSDIGEG